MKRDVDIVGAACGSTDGEIVRRDGAKIREFVVDGNRRECLLACHGHLLGHDVWSVGQKSSLFSLVDCKILTIGKTFGDAQIHAALLMGMVAVAVAVSADAHQMSVSLHFLVLGGIFLCTLLSRVCGVVRCVMLMRKVVAYVVLLRDELK